MPIMRRGQRAKGVAQRGPLRHGRHLHHAEGNADAGAEHQRDDDPFVLDDLRIAQRGADGEGRANLAGQNAMLRR